MNLILDFTIFNIFHLNFLKFSILLKKVSLIKNKKTKMNKIFPKIRHNMSRLRKITRGYFKIIPLFTINLLFQKDVTVERFQHQLSFQFHFFFSSLCILSLIWYIFSLSIPSSYETFHSFSFFFLWKLEEKLSFSVNWFYKWTL